MEENIFLRYFYNNKLLIKNKHFITAVFYKVVVSKQVQKNGSEKSCLIGAKVYVAVRRRSGTGGETIGALI